MIGRLLASSSESNLWWVGVLLDAIATFAGAAGKQLLRYASVTRNWKFYPLGLVCTALIDPAFDISAYSFAAQSIIAPMAGMVIVWNVLLAPHTLGEELTTSRKQGAFLICLGTILVGLFGNHSEVERTVDEYLDLFSRRAAILYYAAFAVWTVLAFVLAKTSSPLLSAFYIGAYGGSLAGNMFTTKAVVEMVECVLTSTEQSRADGCEVNPFYTPYPYIFIFISLAFACLSLYMLALTLRGYEALYMITVFEGFMIISGAISGNVVMGEAQGQPNYLLVLYAASICIILAGVPLTTKSQVVS